MNILLIFVSSFLLIGCSASDSDDLGNKVPIITTDKSLTDEIIHESKVDSNQCSEKCTKEFEGLKKNITELYAAFVKLQSQLEHLNQHMTFHEKAIKHIAIWGHRRNGHHHNDNQDDNQNTSGRNESTLNKEQNEDSDRNMRGQPDNNHDHIHHHHHHDHQHHTHRPHHSHNHNSQCGQCGCGQCPHQPHKGNEYEEPNKKTQNKDKDSSEESEDSAEDKSQTPMTTVLPDSELKHNESIALNDSQIKNPSEKSVKRIHISKPLAEEQLNFQSMQTEFKEWFNNMLDDIHHNNVRVDRTGNGLKVDRRLDQTAMDEMENALNNEELIFATCSVKPNRHIALLNQQDVEGTINLWQLKHNRGPLHMHIKLKGFKANNHEDSHHKHNMKVRRVRESILMPVEVEPDEVVQPIGASHKHGFHVHEFGNLSRDCQSVGNHYNPLNLAHGGPYDVVRHVGDLGNIMCDKNGEIDSEFSYSQLSLSGIHSIINRSLVIHSNIDDYGRNPNSPSSAQTGSSGVRIACCLIEEVKQLPKDIDSQSSIGSVANPITSSKRRRDTSEPTFINRYRYEDPNMSEILKKLAKYENDRKYKTLEWD